MRENDVLATYRLLNHQHPLEIRVIQPPTTQKLSEAKSRSIGGKIRADLMVESEDQFMAACLKWNGVANVHVGSRERRAGFAPTPTPNGGWVSAKKRDITAITTIPIDIDPIRPDGLKYQAATDEELKWALDAAEYLRDPFFAEHGFLPPIRAMSGNGCHLWVCIPRYELPDDGWYKRGPSEFHRMEDAIKSLFDELKHALPPSLRDKVEIDPIHDLTRLIKVIGTTSVKGDPTRYPDRPHRETYFIDAAVRNEDALLLQYLMEHTAGKQHSGSSKAKDRATGRDHDSQPPPRSAPTDHNEPPPQLPPCFRLLLQSDPIIRTFWETGQDDTSDHDWKLGSACISAGITEAADVRAILMNNPHGKYQRDRRTDYLDLTVGKLLALRYQKVWAYEGKYWTLRRIGAQRGAVPITTFVMRVQRQIQRDGNLTREVQITNELGQTIDSVPIEAVDMSTPTRFREFLYRQPIPLKFSGTQRDLIELMDGVLTQSSAPTITELPQVGRIHLQEKPVWAFADVMICEERALHPDRDGIFTLNGVGYRLSDPFGIGIPELPVLGDDPPPHVKNLDDLRRHTAGLLYVNLGFDGWTLLGWVGASLYAHVIRQRYDGFPLLFAVGSREAGKNVFGRWVTAFFKGMKPFGATSSTRVAFERAFHHYSHVPVWVEEYRNTKAVTSKDSVFRAAFDGVADLKGRRGGEGGLTRTPKACVLFTGEEVPNDNAFLSRCAVIELSKKKRNPDSQVFELINDLSACWPALTRELLLKQNTEAERTFLAEVARVYQLLTTITSERQRRHFAIIAAGLRLLMEDTSEYVTWLLEEGRRQQELKEADSLLSEFITDLQTMHLQDCIPVVYYHVEGGQLFLQLKAIYNLWEKYYRQRRGESPLGYRSLLGYLMEKPYFRDASVQKRKGSHVVRYVALDAEGASEDFGFFL